MIRDHNFSSNRSCYEYEFLKFKTSFTKRWSIVTNPLMVLHAKPKLIKNEYLRRRLHHYSEEAIREKELIQ